MVRKGEAQIDVGAIEKQIEAEVVQATGKDTYA
jgi:hypothetical protein